MQLCGIINPYNKHGDQRLIMFQIYRKTFDGYEFYDQFLDGESFVIEVDAMCRCDELDEFWNFPGEYHFVKEV